VNAALIAHALGGRKAGLGWMARCLAHDDQTRAATASGSRARLWRSSPNWSPISARRATQSSHLSTSTAISKTKRLTFSAGSGGRQSI